MINSSKKQEKGWLITKFLLKNIPGLKLPLELCDLLEELDKVDTQEARELLLDKIKVSLCKLEVTEVEFVKCKNFEATLRFEPSDTKNIMLLPIGGPPQEPGKDFDVSGNKLKLNSDNEPSFEPNEALLVIYNRFFQINNE